MIPICLIHVDFSSATVSSSAVTFGAYLYNHLVSNVKNSKMSEQTILKEQSTWSFFSTALMEDNGCMVLCWLFFLLMMGVGEVLFTRKGRAWKVHMYCLRRCHYVCFSSTADAGDTFHLAWDGFGGHCKVPALTWDTTHAHSSTFLFQCSILGCIHLKGLLAIVCLCSMGSPALRTTTLQYLFPLARIEATKTHKIQRENPACLLTFLPGLYQYFLRETGNDFSFTACFLCDVYIKNQFLRVTRWIDW